MGDLGRQIQEARMRRGMSQTELAAYCRVSSTYISKLEHNRRQPSLRLLNLLARALETDVQIFLVARNGRYPASDSPAP